MRTRSKRYAEGRKLVDRKKKYSIEEAVDLIRKTPAAKFDETVQLVLRLGIDAKKSEQMVRGSVTLPRGIGKTRKVIVFAEGEAAEAAKKSGADEVGGVDLVTKVQGGFLDFDIAIAHPSMMRHVGKLGKILGPQGKMPSPKSGTVSENIGQAVGEFKGGKIEYRADASGNLHAPMGKRSFEPQAIADNVRAFLDHIRATRPATVKGSFVLKGTLASAMGPGVPLAI
ncbi:MAG: 50S ribosomal protein L1 [Planctomycetes bacterium]|jgi:large subunit ribosomal protein L1|nr:50S ribosomal protein L1 [Planctomycetota bacterium]